MALNNKICISGLRNIRGLCRVCLTQSKNLVSLYQKLQYKVEGTSSARICNLLEILVNGKLNRDSRYPASICVICFKLLQMCYKFKLQFTESEHMLLEYFKDWKSTKNFIFDSPVLQEDTSCPTVELISNEGVYNLNDIIIVEDQLDGKPNYDGFLEKLGKEISATFVREAEVKVSPKVKVRPALKSKSNCKEPYKNKREVDIVQCQIWSDQKHLTNHINTMHINKEETFLCEFCGLLLKSRSSYYHHMVKHKGKMHLCEFCNKCYFGASHLRLHVEAVHRNSRPHLCTVCGKSFGYTNALTYHMRLHTGEQKYQCTYCERRFTMPNSLKRHLLSHTGMRPYKCNYCNQAFRSKGEGMCHEMIHTGFRPYHCKYCQKGFTKTYNLKVHLMNHSGAHVCDVCSKSFIAVEYLRMHMETVHPI